MSKILDINNDLLTDIALYRISKQSNFELHDLHSLQIEIQKEVLILLKSTEQVYRSIYHGYLCETLGVREDQIQIFEDLQGFQLTRIFEVEAFLTLNSPSCGGLFTLEDALKLSKSQLEGLRTNHVVYNNLTLNEVYALNGESFKIEDGIGVFRAFALEKIYPDWEIKKYNAA